MLQGNKRLDVRTRRGLYSEAQSVGCYFALTMFQIFHNPKTDMTLVESLGIVNFASLSRHELRLAQ